MAFISTGPKSFVGKVVKLTKEKRSMEGYFEVGTIVTITECDPIRGFTFTDTDGNSVSEAGFSGFETI